MLTPAQILTLQQKGWLGGGKPRDLGDADAWPEASVDYNAGAPAPRALPQGMSVAMARDAADRAEWAGKPRPTVDAPSGQRFIQTADEQKAWNKEVADAGSVGEAQLRRLRAGMPLVVDRPAGASSGAGSVGLVSGAYQKGAEAYVATGHGSPTKVTPPPEIAEGKAPDASAKGASGAAGVAGQSFDMGYLAPRGGGGPSKEQKALYEALQADDEQRKKNAAEQEGRGRAAIEAGDEYSKWLPMATTVQQSELRSVQDRQNEITQKALEDQKHDHDQIMARMDALKGVDPERWWNKKDSGQKVLSAFAVALGEFGSKLVPGGNGRNAALDIMNNAIDNDIRAQKTNLDSEWAKISKGLDVSDKKFARAQWESHQVDNERVFALEKFKTWAQTYQQRAATADKAAQIGNLISAAQEQQIAIQDRQAQRRAAFMTAGQGGGSGPTAKDLEAYQKYSAKYAELEAEGKTSGPMKGFGQFYNENRLGRVVNTPGAVPPGGRSPFSGIPEKDHAGAEKELEKTAGAKEDAAQLDKLGSSLESTAWDPTRLYGESKAGQAREQHESWNLFVDGLVHKKFGAKMNPDQIKKFSEQYHVEGGTLQDKIERTKARAVRDLIGQPETPILDAYGKGAPKEARIPGATVR